MASKINFHHLKMSVSRYIRKLESILLTVIFILCMSFLAANDTAKADVFGCFVGAGNPAAATCNTLPALTSSTDGSKCVQGTDWFTQVSPDNSDITVLSIHGGSIELRTSNISQDLRNLYNWNRYNFQGQASSKSCTDLKPNGCTIGDSFCVLHITSANFNDPAALQLVENNRRAVSIHGCSSSCSTNTICIGGRNVNTRNIVRNYINQYKNLVSNSPRTFVDDNNKDLDTDIFCDSDIMGTDQNNIVNRTSTNEGLQLEISRNIRDALANTAIENDLLRTIVYGGTAEGVDELPLPILTYEGKNGNQYNFNVPNNSEYPGDLFALNPNLALCPNENQAFRTWVNIYNGSNNQLITRFCQISSPQDLDTINFSTNNPPTSVYITLEDREFNRIYRSNRVTITP